MKPWVHNSDWQGAHLHNDKTIRQILSALVLDLLVLSRQLVVILHCRRRQLGGSVGGDAEIILGDREHLHQWNYSYRAHHWHCTRHGKLPSH